MRHSLYLGKLFLYLFRVEFAAFCSEVVSVGRTFAASVVLHLCAGVAPGILGALWHGLHEGRAVRRRLDVDGAY